jgi:hypothetical protein
VDVGKAFEQVVAFRQNRGATGGANQVILAKATGRWACPMCVDRMRAGVHPLQATLAG